MVMEPDPDEYRLALGARAGDRAALAALVERTRAWLLRLALADLREPQDAQDAVAAALLQVCRRVGELREPARARAWMQSILRNEIRAHCRRRAGAAFPLAEVEEEAGGERDPVLRLDIDRALGQLPAGEAAALRGFYLDDLSIEQIAREAGCPEGTVKSWLHRGRRRLAAAMEGYEPMTTLPEAREPAALVHTDLDSAIVRRATAELRRAGFRAKVLRPEDPLRTLKSLIHYRVVVLDEWLAGRSAFEYLTLLRAHPAFAQITVCLLCEAPSELTLAAGWTAGVECLLDKRDRSSLALLAKVGGKPVLPEVVPVIPLRDRVIFPHQQFPLMVGRERTLQALEAAARDGGYALAVAQREATVENPGPPDLYQVGTLGRVGQMLRQPDGSVRVRFEAGSRARIVEHTGDDPCLRARVESLAEPEEEAPEVETAARELMARLWDAPGLVGLFPLRSVEAMLSAGPGRFADLLSACLPLTVAQQQELLETLSPRDRVERLGRMVP